jgi:hypothetical protein
MGKVHDCDVQIPRLKSYLEEIRHFNRKRSAVDRVVTTALTKFIREQIALRQHLFNEVVTALRKWEKDDFAARLKNSMFKSKR